MLSREPGEAVAARGRPDRSAFPRSSNPTRGTFPRGGGRRAIARRRYTPRRSPLPTPTMSRTLPGFARLALVFALAFVALAARAALPPGVTQGTTVEGITEYSLENGLKVLLFPDATKPTIDRERHLSASARATRATAKPGMAHLLEHLMFKGTPSHRQHLPRSSAGGAMRFNGSTSYDRTNYFETFTAIGRESRLGARDGGRPHGQLLRREEGPRHRDDGGAQRVRARGEQPAASALGAPAGRRVRLAQLRQSVDRRALRHRERRHRPAAGLLPAALPARQRRADGRRQVRSRAHARSGGEIFRPDSETGARAPRPVHARTGARRRTRP